jgi:hypothetical protein
MIKKLLRWLFKKEYQEAKDLIEQAKAYNNKVFINYTRYPLDSKEFILGVQLIINSEFLTIWLNERKLTYDSLVKYGTVVNRENNIGRSMAIDELLKDADTFKSCYKELLEMSKVKTDE